MVHRKVRREENKCLHIPLLSAKILSVVGLIMTINIVRRCSHGKMCYL